MSSFGRNRRYKRIVILTARCRRALWPQHSQFLLSINCLRNTAQFRGLAFRWRQHNTPDERPAPPLGTPPERLTGAASPRGIAGGAAGYWGTG